MGLACDVYSRLMFTRGHGYPLWEPEPTESGEVLIGDVGYILDGGFYRLFNATLPPHHPIHERWGVPDPFELFEPSEALLHHRPNALAAGAICSKSVLAISMEGSANIGLAGTGPNLSGRMRFKCTDEQGAMLILKHDATRDDLHPSKDLKQYIIRNHDSWFRFAQDVFRLDLPQHRIIFISGSVKTAEWALVALTHSAHEGEIAFSGEFVPSASAAFSIGGVREMSMSIEQRCGPKRPSTTSPEPGSARQTHEVSANAHDLVDGQIRASATGLKFDQCVFMHYYKLKRRRVIGPKVIRAASEVPVLLTRERRSESPSAQEQSGMHMEVTRGDSSPLDVSSSPMGSVSELEHTRKEDFTDPVETILDYILDNTDAVCAIASDADLKLIDLEELTSLDKTNVSALLSLCKPQITVTHDGVATLSHDIYGGTAHHSLTRSPVGQTATGSRNRSPSVIRARPRSIHRARSRVCSPLTSDPPVKRKLARPPGSKNEKTLDAARAMEPAGPSSADGPKRLRGRPSKRKSEDDEKDIGELSERPPKKRGRPRKNPVPSSFDDSGRPRKDVSRNDAVQVQPASSKGKGRLHESTAQDKSEEERPRKRVKRDYNS